MTATDLLVLHALRCVGFASVPLVSGVTGLAAHEVESELIDLAVAGLVTRTPGDFGGWGITESGRVTDAERIAGELDAAGARAAVTESYEDFLMLNPELLDLCGAWQTRSADDPAYPVRILNRLTDFHRRAESMCADLTAALPRFGRYRVRLTEALTRATAGEDDYVATGTGSYHTVWFQLHEDLLVTLGVPR